MECWRRGSYGYPAVPWRALVWKERYGLGPLVRILRSWGSRGAESRQQRRRGRIIVCWDRGRRGRESLYRGRGLCSAAESVLFEANDIRARRSCCLLAMPMKLHAYDGHGTAVTGISTALEAEITYISRGYIRVTLLPCLSLLPSSYLDVLRPRT